ncbi:hypothetical protein Daesc_009037 [Daldinia eschscholtzii]|uniref:Uncharacterized protein n=1 Tax=Daldinia eschscholtzii TaxID=292717 RepID=A0AAX6M8J1_9PEZI
METEGRNLRIDGKAVNAAQGGVSVEQQHIDQRKEHEINQNPQTNVIINNQYDRGIYERRMVPADPAASFIDQQLLRAIILARSDDIQYDDRVGSHVRVEQAERLTEYIASLWENTSSVVDSLNQSIRKFHVFGCLISATIGGVEIDPAILRCLDELAQMFYHAEDYLALCASRTLDKSLHEETVQTFEALAVLLRELVDGDLALYVLRAYKTFLNSTAFQNSAVDEIPYRRKDAKRQVLPMETHKGPSPATVAMQYLAHDPSQVMQDFEEAASSPGSINGGAMRYLHALTKQQDFKNWLRVDNSKVTNLLIHGGLDDDDSGGALISPLSYLCTRIPMEYVRKSRGDFIYLHYFCSLQRARQQNNNNNNSSSNKHTVASANACDIVRSLSGQLLTHGSLASAFDLSFLDEAWQRGLRSHDFVKTCQLFLRLLKQLEHHDLVVFCFLDSISLYETTASLRRDTETLFASLEEYSKTQRRRRRKAGGKRSDFIFKLLVTDAMATGYVRKYFRRKGEMIDLDGDDEPDDDGDGGGGVDLDVLYG